MQTQPRPIAARKISPPLRRPVARPLNVVPLRPVQAMPSLPQRAAQAFIKGQWWGANAVAYVAAAATALTGWYWSAATQQDVR